MASNGAQHWIVAIIGNSRTHQNLGVVTFGEQPPACAEAAQQPKVVESHAAWCGACDWQGWLRAAPCQGAAARPP